LLVQRGNTMHGAVPENTQLRRTMRMHMTAKFA
jgi:hypothetical protein